MPKLPLFLLLALGLPLGAQDRALDSRTAYKLQQALASLDAAETSQDARQRTITLERTRDSLQRMIEADRAAHGALHPELAAAWERLVSLESGAATDNSARAALEDDVLPAVETSLEEAFAAIQSTTGSARSQIALLRRGRGGDIDALRALADKLRRLVPEVEAVAAGIRGAYPDPAALRATAQGPGILQLLGFLEDAAGDWAPLEEEAVAAFLGQATAAIEEAEARLAEAREQPGMTVPAAQSLGFAWEACRAVFALRPEEQADPAAEAAAAIVARIEEGEREIARIEQKRVDDALLAVQRARFPVTDYAGADRAALEEELRAAYADFAPDREIVRVAVSEPWFERTLAYWDDDGQWVVAHVRFCNGYIGAVLPSGKAYVYAINFTQDRAGDGWSRGRVNVVNHARQILPEHLQQEEQAGPRHPRRR